LRKKGINFTPFVAPNNRPSASSCGHPIVILGAELRSPLDPSFREHTHRLLRETLIRLVSSYRSKRKGITSGRERKEFKGNCTLYNCCSPSLECSENTYFSLLKV
jgi:hypothetical protein